MTDEEIISSQNCSKAAHEIHDETMSEVNLSETMGQFTVPIWTSALT